MITCPEPRGALRVTVGAPGQDGLSTVALRWWHHPGGRRPEVAQNEPDCLTPRQGADGYVLTCTSCPLSKVTLDIADP